MGSTTPTQWLQTHLHPGPVDGTAIPWFALLVSLVYCSHYLVMPITAVVTWLRDRSEFRQWMTMVVTLAVAGLATYVLLPTAPPWLASYQGDLGGPPVLRLTSEGFDQVGLNMVGSALKLGQGLVNPVAAMPSLHVAFATLAAGFWWSRVRRPYRPLLLLYPRGDVLHPGLRGRALRARRARRGGVRAGHPRRSLAGRGRTKSCHETPELMR